MNKLTTLLGAFGLALLVSATAAAQAPSSPPPVQSPPRVAPTPDPAKQEAKAPPSARGQSTLDEVDPFLKYAENVKLRVTQADLQDFPVVRAFVSVEDQQGIQIRTLLEGNFTLDENKTPVTDLHFANRAELDLPLAIMFVVDVSGSMMEGGALDLEKEAIRQFAGQLGPKDRVGLITFSDAAIPEVPLTTDKDRLLRALETMTAYGQTALWDGVYRGMEELIADDQPARRALLVLSDGGDNRSVETPQTISQLYSDKATAENKGFAAYCLGLGPEVDRGALGSIATATNGQYLASPTAQDLANVYADILRQIQNEYLLEYTSATVSSPGQIVDISVGLNNVKSFKPGLYTYRSPGLAAALGRAVWPGLLLISVLVAILIITTIFKITRRAWLTVMVTPLEGRDYQLGAGDFEIGRSEACAIRIGRDAGIAPLHAGLRETGDGWLIEAHDQSAPIVYGKQLLARKLLRHGDAFMLGGTTFVFNERVERNDAGRAEPVAALGAQTSIEEPPLPSLGGTNPAGASRPRPAPAALNVISGPHAGQSFGLAVGDNVIGRSEGQIVLGSDSQISRRHCSITLSGDVATVLELGSTNGTRLNGLPLQPGMASPLHAGDVLELGTSQLRAE